MLEARDTDARDTTTVGAGHTQPSLDTEAPAGLLLTDEERNTWATMVRGLYMQRAVPATMKGIQQVLKGLEKDGIAEVGDDDHPAKLAVADLVINELYRLVREVKGDK